MTDFSQKNKERNENQDSSLNGVDGLFARVSNSTDPNPRPGYKEALHARLKEAREKTTMPRFSFAPWLFESFGKLSAVGVTVLVIIIISTLVYQPFVGVKPVYAQDNFTLIAEEADSLGISPQTTYLLESENPVKLSDIKENLTTNIEIEYELDQINDNQIRIAFADPLPERDIVRFELATQVETAQDELTLRPYAWAFQVKGEFQVMGTIPGNERTEVPLDSGIEINFSHENVTVKDFERAFSITPEASGHVEKSRKTLVFVPDQLQKATVYKVKIDSSLLPEGSEQSLEEDYEFTFETAGDPAPGQPLYRQSFLSISKRIWDIDPEEQLVIPFYFYSRDTEKADSAQVTLHQFKTFDGYMKANLASREHTWRRFAALEDIVDPADLGDEINLSVNVTEEEDNSYRNRFVFPEPLEVGYYFGEIDYLGQKTWIMVVSTELTAYLAQATDRTVVWVNSSKTNGPIEGALVSYDQETDSSKTNAEGVAFLTTKEVNFIKVVAKNQAIAIPVFNEGYSIYRYHESDQPYWTHFSTDRQVYKPTDTVYFWGFLQDRELGGL
ncbi:Ig-like domain-containing protein [Patescibacteria group bacterium]